jgi:hypothetical protein
MYGSETIVVPALSIAITDRTPILALCRRLVSEGHEDTSLTAYRDDVPCIHVRSIHEAARLTVKDDSRGTPRLRATRWEPEGACE